MREEEELIILKAKDIIPEAINKNFTSIRLLEKNQFLDMAKTNKFNASPGSVFGDDRKHYFFFPPLCYTYEGRL